jgi:hypothetical protein
MAAHGEIQRPPVGKFNDRLWGDSHGHRQLHLAGGDLQPAR